jgi:hypothetical protein
MKVTPIEEVSYGTYIWQTAEGKLVTDEEGNFMCIFSTKGNVSKIAELRRFAKEYGVEEGGSPVWFSGHRPVSQEEYESQKQRMDWGLVADEYDLPALKEDLVQKKKMGII